jgi:hypothetical protein
MLKSALIYQHKKHPQAKRLNTNLVKNKGINLLNRICFKIYHENLKNQLNEHETKQAIFRINILNN